MVHVLLEAGADLEAALQVARRNNYPEAVKTLQAAATGRALRT